MAQPHKIHNQKNSEKAVNQVAKIDSTHDKIKSGAFNNERAKSERDEAKCNKPPVRTNVVSYNMSMEWQPIIANIVSFTAVGVSLWLAIVTYRLYRIASGQFNSVKKAGDAAEKSAIIAQRTFDMTKQYNKEINAPYLQVQIDKLIIHDTTDKPGMVVFVYYTIYNLTHTPVKIISKKRSHPSINPTVPPPTEEKDMVIIPDVNNYVIKESPDSEYAYGRNIYTKEVFNDLRMGHQKLYMDEIIEYQNLISGEKRKYEFRVQVTLTTSEVPSTVFLYNENSDDK